MSLTKEDIDKIAEDYRKIFIEADRITALDFLSYLHHRLPGASEFFSIERPCQRATNSELRRWFNNKAVSINGKRPAFNEEIEFPIWELTLFPKAGGKRIVLASKELPFILCKQHSDLK